MKKIFTLLLTIFLLISCGEEKELESAKEVGAVKEAGEIIEGYVDTLETSAGDAREVRDLMNIKQDKLQKGIQDAYK